MRTSKRTKLLTDIILKTKAPLSLGWRKIDIPRSL